MSQGFQAQPKANRFTAILETVAPSRQNPTTEKILAVVNALIQAGAIRADEGGQMFDALLQRVCRYNSTNLQANLDNLVADIRNLSSLKERSAASQNLGSLVAFNAFLSSLPASVGRGQGNYTAFLSSLRVLVNEAPQTEIYQAGPQFFMQSSRTGTFTVNLTKAFENLFPLWGLEAAAAEASSVSSLLTPNTRLLLLLTAPFASGFPIERESYIGHLLNLYRETLGNVHMQEKTFQEITEASRDLDEDGVENLQKSLNLLLTNKVKKLPAGYALTAREERILRFIQQSVSLYMMQENIPPVEALDRTAANFEASFYSRNRLFVNRLMDYFHRAAVTNPSYFNTAVLNPHWLPPEGFFTGDFEIPLPDEGLQWDDMDSSLARIGSKEDALLPSLPVNLVDDDARSLSELGAASAPLNNNLAPVTVRAPVTEVDLMASDSSGDMKNEFESLAQKFARWKTYAQQHREQVQGLNPVNVRPRDEDIMMEGSGGRRSCPAGNVFAHLMPNGCNKRSVF